MRAEPAGHLRFDELPDHVQSADESTLRRRSLRQRVIRLSRPPARVPSTARRFRRGRWPGARAPRS
jgi:hypothetical protein